ncbi:MAG: YciI family protein [bacterium]
MQFVIKAYDGAGKLERRMEVRPRHLENMSKINGKVICAGGLLDEEGKMKGSLMVMEFESRAVLEEYLKSEPYITDGVWEKVDVEQLNVVLVNGEKYVP